MGLAGLVPLPADALVTPVTFRVRKRNLRGILAALDEKESGTRELSGEWIIGKKLWQTLQSDYRSSHLPANKDAVLEDSLNGGPSSRKRHSRVILYVHGGASFLYSKQRLVDPITPGAYYSSSAASHRMITIPMSKYTESRIFGSFFKVQTCISLISASDRLSPCARDPLSGPVT